MLARPLTVLIAPDSFKGSLTSVAVARALADGWATCPARRHHRCCVRWRTAARARSRRSRRPAAGSGRTRAARDPLGRQIEARWLRLDDGARAVIEMAEASGLSRVAPGERDASRHLAWAPATPPGGAGCRGPDVIARDRRERHDRRRRRAADAAWARRRPRLRSGRPRRPRSSARRRRDAGRVRRVEPAARSDGAAAVYGPQKGATPDDVPDLDRRPRALRGSAGRGDRPARTRRRVQGRPAASASAAVRSRTRSGGSRCGPASTS